MTERFLVHGCPRCAGRALSPPSLLAPEEPVRCTSCGEVIDRWGRYLAIAGRIAEDARRTHRIGPETPENAAGRAASAAS